MLPAEACMSKYAYHMWNYTSNLWQHSHSTTKLDKWVNLFLDDTDKDILLSTIVHFSFLMVLYF